MASLLAKLAEDLVQRHDEIVTRWRRACEDDRLGRAVHKLTRAEFEDNLADSLASLRAALIEEPTAVGSGVAEHGHHRWKQGFHLEELIRDWALLNRVLVRLFNTFFRQQGDDGSEEHALALDRLAVFMLHAMSASVTRYDELRQAAAASLVSDVELAKARLGEASTARAQLLREMTHDIRGSLSNIASAGEVIKQTSDAALPVIDIMQRNVAAVNDMLGSLLELSRLEAGAEEVELTVVDVAALLHDIVREHGPAADHKGLDLRAEGPSPLRVPTDPAKLRRIVQNLVRNAINYTETGSVTLSWERQQRRWCLEIRDTGPGMEPRLGTPIARELDHHPGDGEIAEAPPEAQPYAGEGIGLAIVHRLCSMLDASVSMDSTPGAGTTFVLAFPSYVSPG